MSHEQEWKKISEVLFSTQQQREAPDLVDRVMAGLPPEKRSIWDWFVPSLGFGFAAALFLLTCLPLNNQVYLDDFFEDSPILDQIVSEE